MPLVEWLDVRTAVAAGILIETSRWAIGRVSQSTQKRQARKRQQPSRATLVLQELARIAATSLIVVFALTYVQSSTNYKQLAKHLTERQTVILAQAYLGHDQSQQLLDYLNAHASLLVSSFSDPAVREATWIADHQHLVHLGLLEDGGIVQGEEIIKIRRRRMTARSLQYASKVTPLGMKVIRWKLRLPPPSPRKAA